jgi:hypothetical protein
MKAISMPRNTQIEDQSIYRKGQKGEGIAVVVGIARAANSSTAATRFGHAIDTGMW